MATCTLQMLTTEDRITSRQRVRFALAVLQTVSVDQQPLSHNALYMLRDLAQSDAELAMEPDALARTIIARETPRLTRECAREATAGYHANGAGQK